jgi:hypothetical protein
MSALTPEQIEFIIQSNKEKMAKAHEKEAKNLATTEQKMKLHVADADKKMYLKFSETQEYSPFFSVGMFSGSECNDMKKYFQKYSTLPGMFTCEVSNMRSYRINNGPLIDTNLQWCPPK